MSSGTIARAGLTVSALFLASRLLGWLRISVLAAIFGVGPDLDAFYAAFRIPDLMFQLVAAGALSSALIPILGGMLANGETARTWRLVSTVMNVLLIALAVLAILFAIAAPAIVPIVTPGFSSASIDQTVLLTRIMLGGPIFLALGSVVSSALNAENRFGAAALAPIVYNLGIIGGAVFLSPWLGVAGLGVGVVAGSAAHLAVQLPSLRRSGFRWLAIIDRADSKLREALVLMAPRSIGLGATQVAFVVITTLASTLGEGAITAFNFAFTIVLIPAGIIGLPLGVVVFPSLVQRLATHGADEYLALIVRALRILLFTMVPLSAITILLRTQIVTVLVGYGRLGAGDVDGIATTLAYLAAGLVAFSGIGVLARAFYARHDTRTPVAAAVLNVVICSGLGVVLVGPYGLAGIAIALAIAETAELVVLVAVLRRREPGFALRVVGTMLGAALAATAVATVAGYVTLNVVTAALGSDASKVAQLIEGAAVTAVFGGIYLALAAVLRLPELRMLLDLALGFVRRGSRGVPTSA